MTNSNQSTTSARVGKARVETCRGCGLAFRYDLLYLHMREKNGCWQDYVAGADVVQVGEKFLLRGSFHHCEAAVFALDTKGERKRVLSTQSAGQAAEIARAFNWSGVQKVKAIQDE